MTVSCCFQEIDTKRNRNRGLNSSEREYAAEHGKFRTVCGTDRRHALRVSIGILHEPELQPANEEWPYASSAIGIMP